MRFVPGLVPAPFLLTCGRRMFRAAGTEYRSARRGRTCGFGYYRDLSRLLLGISGFPLTFGFGCLFFYKVSTLFFDCSFWLHQGRIPRHTCRFHCCLAAHQRTRKKDSAEPSFPMEPRLRGSVDSASSTRGVRCGGAFWLPRLTGI